ncbi:MAG: SGNH/GDSL hydrolase family protein, partial [Clostridia bacterium]|nr:SGNH/GDSL hydrolase family protein [Clostridia bacterium]
MNKNIIFLGSSVTYGDDGWSMCEYVRQEMGCNVTKWAVSGTTLADVSDDSYVSRLKKQINTQDRCDCFVCQLSTNDAGRNLPLGEISSSKNIDDFDLSTVIGAIEYIIARVTE